MSYNKPAQIQEPVSCADELLRYDPDTGLFDVNYGAAWQFGRLLALQNQAFALALDRARSALRAKAERLMRQDELERQREKIGLPEKGFLEDRVMEQLSGAIGRNLADAVPR